MRSSRGIARPLGAAAGVALAVMVSGCAGDTGAEPEREEQQELSPGEVLSDTGPDGHPLREVPQEEAPSVELTVEPDAHDGWNVHLETEGFEFTPQRSGSNAKGGQGHAHLYIDGEKHSRMYGPWFHLPGEALDEEQRTIQVTLNADDHTTWAVDGEPVRAEQEVDGSEAAEPHDHADDAEGEEEDTNHHGEGHE